MSNQQSSNAVTWRVFKFGGSSVTSAAHWHIIATRISEALDAGVCVAVVVSALRGMTDLLAAQLDASTRQRPETVLAEARQRHARLLAELEIAPEALDDTLSELQALLESTDASSPPTQQAALLGMGELLSSRLGRIYLELAGLPAHWLDSRKTLTCPLDPRRDMRASYLSATCPGQFSPALVQQLSA
ncbi:MAG: hypothetical protein ACNA7J_07030, partial [Wenzhouxiangella sp.]